MANKVYELVTEQIIHQLETAIQQGSPAPWCKPWNCNTVPINHISGKQYNGINLLLLPDCDEYLTWAQLCDLQKHRPELKLKKGSKSHMVVYFSFKESEKDTVTTDGQLEKERVQIPFLRYYRVFSIGDVEGGLQPKRKVSHYEHDPIEEADKVCNDYINREGITLHFADADRAFYNPSCDTVQVPPSTSYSNLAEYYSTLFHELTHSTGHPNRLNRIKSTSFFGNTEYSKEELVAEVGANMIMSALGIENNAAQKNSIAYLQGWLQALKNDMTMIVSACSKAQKAADYILEHNEECSEKSLSSQISPSGRTGTIV